MGILSTTLTSRNSNNNVILAAGATLLVASFGLGYMAFRTTSNKGIYNDTDPNELSSSRALTTVTEIDDIDDEDNNNNGEYITENDVIKIFDQLNVELQNAFNQLMNQVQQIQMTGQRIPEQQLQLIMKQELERALLIKQGPIIEMHHIDYDCLQEATWEYMNPVNANYSVKVKTSVEKLQKLWQTATGEHVIGWTPFTEPVQCEVLNPEQTIEAATAYFNALTNCMRNLIQEYEQGGKDLHHPMIQQELNIDFTNTANDVGELALQNLGYTQQQFEKSVTEHQNNTTVTRALTMLSIQQQQEFTTMRSS
jgi:hypothetical protein